jgi:glycerol-3-phosphate acyltransferase PlsX
MQAPCPMRIAVDAMGGDLGPEEVVRGAVEAARQRIGAIAFLIVGDEKTLKAELARTRAVPPNVCVVHASQVMGMEDKPREVLRKKSDSSVAVSARLVKEGDADAFISIGNTGAAMAASLFMLRTIPGIDRPAIATPLPSLAGKVALLDAGANVDCAPHQLLEFAVMGSCYSSQVLGVTQPTVGLLSNGEEPTKGNDLTKQTHQILREKLPQFKGNVEGRDVFRGVVNVVVCDGFSGNIVLKTGEGVAEMVLDLLKQELNRNQWMKPLLIPFRKGFRRMRDRIDYREFGGAPLLGVNGVCIIGHGRSDSRAIVNAVKVAEASVKNNLVKEIERTIAAIKHPADAAPPGVEGTGQ